MVRLFIILLFLIFSGNAFATTYYVCGNVTWNGSASSLYTTANCSSGGPLTPTLTTADEIIINLGAVVIVENIVTIDVNKLTVYGTLYIKSGSNPGKLELPSNSATVVLQTGSKLACYDGTSEVACAANATQIVVGSGGSKYTYKGSDLDVIDSQPKPITIDNTGSALPIELLYFNVSIPKNEKHTLIEWATSSEENFDHFEIERAGGNLEFSTLLEVPGAGYNTTTLQTYSAYDENPLVGVNYYRLKAVDLDETYEHFKIRSVNYTGGRKLLVSPNPSSGSSLKYSINFEPGPYDRVSLINQVGTELFTAPVKAIENELVLDSKLKAGAYMLRYTSPDFQYVARVFIKE
jgi:hypothetical protein